MFYLLIINRSRIALKTLNFYLLKFPQNERFFHAFLKTFQGINEWELIFIYCGLFPHVGSFCVVSTFTTFQPNFTSSGDLPRPRIGMLSLVTVSPVITAFHSCCLSHHVFDQVNLWPGWVGIETAIFWQCSPGTAETHGQ